MLLLLAEKTRVGADVVWVVVNLNSILNRSP